MTRALPALFDVIAVVFFAAVGRRSHAEGIDLAGIVRTAGPFLLGTAAGWLLAATTLDSGPRSLQFGAVVLAATVVLGMLFRRVASEGTAFSFVIVATTVLAALLLGWRLIARLV
ncbi:MAG: DUF3054 domain-containing protein [Ornithinibacter sp.]